MPTEQSGYVYSKLLHLFSARNPRYAHTNGENKWKLSDAAAD